MNAEPSATEKAMQKATQETVIALRRWSDNLFTFTTTKPAGYSFTAGQYARLGLLRNNDMVWRAYSMTSAPEDPHLEFYGILVPEGLFTSRLKELQPGDPIWVERQSYGFMTVDRFTGGDDLWMLGTGTGVGPYISILRDAAVWARFRRLTLVHCVRHAVELTYVDELTSLAKAPPVAHPAPASLRILRSVTREPATDSGLMHGRITTLLASGALESAAGLPITEEASRIMLCGNPEMIEDTRKLLHARGLKPVRRVAPGQFVTENYW